jgi:hypothetical protein
MRTICASICCSNKNCWVLFLALNPILPLMVLDSWPHLESGYRMHTIRADWSWWYCSNMSCFIELQHNWSNLWVIVLKTLKCNLLQGFEFTKLLQWNLGWPLVSLNCSHCMYIWEVYVGPVQILPITSKPTHKKQNGKVNSTSSISLWFEIF